MANALYDGGREGFLDGSIDWDTDTIKAVVVDTALYTVNLGTHRNLSDVASGARNGASAALSGKTVTAGVADASDTSIVATAAVSTEAIVIYKDTGVEATSRLIAYIDTGTGLPFTPGAGGTVNILWSNTADRIFKL